jgi:hypothetical protein
VTAVAGSEGRGHWILRGVGKAVAVIVALFLVGRGVAEFFTVTYSDPASYRDAWGGPSLAGVFAVHSGPAVIILVGAVVAIRRRRKGGLPTRRG